MCEVGYYANTTYAQMLTGAFECRLCEDTHEGNKTSISMTNCTTLNATLDRIPLRAGYWRQNEGAEYVRACDYEDACLGGVHAGNASCAEGHRGPLCDRARRAARHHHRSHHPALCRACPPTR